VGRFVVAAPGADADHSPGTERIRNGSRSNGHGRTACPRIGAAGDSRLDGESALPADQSRAVGNACPDAGATGGRRCDNKAPSSLLRLFATQQHPKDNRLSVSTRVSCA